MTAPSTVESVTPSAASSAPATAAAGRRRRVTRVVLTVAVLVLVVQVVLSGQWFGTAVQAATSASLPWTAAAALAVGGSILCFSAVRLVALRSAGTRIRLTDLLSLTVAAGAINATMPGGAVFSTAYAFRALRSRGLTSAATTWTLAITGVLSTVSLVVLVLGAALVGGGASGILSTVVEVGVLLGVLVLLTQLTRDPRRLLPIGAAVLRVGNRLRRRVPEQGIAGWHRAVDDLAGIRPTGRQALAATVLSFVTWLFEVACLAACLAAVGVEVSFAAVLLTYAAGKAVTSVSPLPAGIGVVEGAMVVGLTAAGAPAAAALAGVLIYRLLTVGGVAVVGGIVLGLERVRAGRPGVVAAAA